MEFSGDERHLYVSASDTLNAYSVETGELEWQYRPPRHFGFLIVSPLALAVARDGTIGASFDYGSMALLTPDGEVIWRQNENYAPRRMAFMHQDKDLVGADAFNLCIWDAQSGRQLERLKLDHKIYAMALLPAENMIATRELYTMSLYSVQPFQKEFEIPAGRGLPNLAASSMSRLIASGEKNRIRIVNLEGQGVRDIHVTDANVLSLAFTSDGNRVIAGCSDGYVRQWDVDSVDN
jgi:WD40 repeat protein